MKIKKDILLIKIPLIIALCIIFSLLIVLKPKYALIISFVLIIIPIAYIIFINIDKSIRKIPEMHSVKRYAIYFLFIYPLLPALAGINLGMSLPIIRIHRFLIMIFILYLIGHKLFLNYYKSFFSSNIFTIPILLMITSLFTTSLISSEFKTSFFYSLSFCLEVLILPVIIFNIFKTKKDIYLLINVIIFSGLILCFFGIFEQITTINIFSYFGAYGDAVRDLLIQGTRNDRIRISGPFGHSISFGSYLSLILPFTLYRFKKNYSLWAVTTLLILITQLATQARTGLISMIIVFVLYFIFIEKKNISISLLISLPVILYFLPAIIAYLAEVNPFTASQEELVNSTSARLLQFEYLSGLIVINPIFGAGLIPFQGLMLTPQNWMQSIDNFYLLYTYNFGLFGLATWIILFFSTFIKSLLILKNTNNNDKLIIIICISNIAFMIINIIVSLYTYHFIFWINIGILTRLIYINKQDINI